MRSTVPRSATSSDSRRSTLAFRAAISPSVTDPVACAPGASEKAGASGSPDNRCIHRASRSPGRRGSAFGGFTGNTLFYNTTGGIAAHAPRDSASRPAAEVHREARRGVQVARGPPLGLDVPVDALDLLRGDAHRGGDLGGPIDDTMLLSFVLEAGRDALMGVLDDLRAHGGVQRWLVDPPREGAFALAKAVADIAENPDLAPGWTPPKRIVYVSCNPSTLARDAARLLAGGYQLVTRPQFAQAIERGFLQIVYGGAEEGFALHALPGAAGLALALARRARDDRRVARLPAAAWRRARGR